MEYTDLNNKLIGILRGYDSEDALFAAETGIKAGLSVFEFAIRQGHEREDITTLLTLRKYLPENILLGAGTVLDLRTLNAVQRCGVDFVVSPGLMRDVLALSQSRGMLCIPGALTPTEILEAYNLGAQIVKLFPADAFGPEYIRAIRAPLSHIPLIAMGGITPENIGKYSKAGVTAFGISTGFFVPDEVKKHNEAAIQKRITAYNDALKDALK